MLSALLSALLLLLLLQPNDEERARTKPHVPMMLLSSAQCVPTNAPLPRHE